MQHPVSDPIDPEEWGLIQSAQHGDHGAFERLLSLLQKDLDHFFEREAERSSRFSAAELKAESVTRFWTSLHRFDNQYRFRSYAFGIAIQTAKRLNTPKKTKMDGFDDLEGGQQRFAAGAVQDRRTPRSGRAARVDTEPTVDWTSIRPKKSVYPELSSSSVYVETLIAFLHYGGFPHQQMAFAFSLLGWGEAARAASGEHQKVPISGDPDRVVNELSSEQLIRLCQDFRRELDGMGDLAESALSEAFAPLDFRLTLLVRELFEGDATSRRVFERLGELRTSTTTLGQYFGKNPRGSVAEWTAKVKNRVRSVVGGGTSTKRGFLPFPPQ